MRISILILALLASAGGCKRGCAAPGQGAPPDPDASLSWEISPDADPVFTHLKALGYVTEAQMEPADEGKKGVTVHDENRSLPGVNLYCSENTGTATFMDMTGKVLHTVTVDPGETRWEDNLCKVARFADTDSLVMVIEDTSLVKVGLDSTVEWTLKGRYHHDVDVTSDGSIHALRNEEILVEAIDPQVPVLDNLFVTLDPDGEETSRLSLASMVTADPVLLERTRGFVEFYREQTKPEDRPEWLDVFHVNTVDVLDERIEVSDDLAFEKGWILFCSRYLDLVGVIDPEAKRIVWHWGPGELQWPHHPSFVEDGRILVFDNGTFRKHSRLLVVDPAARKAVWQFTASPREAFFSSTRGGAQKLPNGNILVTDSDSGHAFEITTGGEIVWEFYNPDVTADGKRSTIFRMIRLAPDEIPAGIPTA